MTIIYRVTQIVKPCYVKQINVNTGKASKHTGLFDSSGLLSGAFRRVLYIPLFDIFDLTRKKSWYNCDRCSCSWIKFDSSRWKTRRRRNRSHLMVESLTISCSIVLNSYNYYIALSYFACCFLYDFLSVAFQ